MATSTSENFWYSLLSFGFHDSDESDDSERPQKQRSLIVVERRSAQSFCTNSIYEGTWDQLENMTGEGTYILPHGISFHGKLNEGTFGEGVYTYPGNQTIERKNKEYIARYADGMVFSAPFNYCAPTDRRYHITKIEGYKSAGHERLTDNSVDRPIPAGCYDTVDGFYNPQLKCVVSAYDPNIILRIPTPKEERWIKKHCRKAWDEPVGYAPQYYPKWTTGIRSDLDPEPDDIVSTVSLDKMK